MNELKEKELIETNAVLQESLTKENEKYYGNLLIYIRIMAFFRDVKKSEELLLEVLRDILDAQEQGLSAECLWQDKRTYNCSPKVHNSASSLG